MQTDLTGKVALVTGSSKWVGKAIALKLAENGADLVINGRNEEPGLETVEQIKSMGRRAIFEQADICSYAEVQQMVDNAIEKLGKVDILVVSGGASAKPEASLPTFFRSMDPGLYTDFVATRLLSRAYAIKAVLEHMIEKQYGKIIMLTTDAGRWPTPGEAINGAAAAGVVMITKTLAKEFTRWGIRVNTLSISLTISEEGFDQIFASSIGSVFEKLVKRMPFGPNKQGDVAEAALFFASPDSDQITGHTMSINGGVSFP